MKPAQHTQHQESEETISLLDNDHVLIVWNDDYNTFDWVIQSLMEVCGHDQIQAEQCALIIHNKGKYAVKNGDFETLKAMADSINERGINATVETLA